MKNKIIAAVIVILSLLAAIGPKTLFPVCPVGEMKMRCYSTANAELIVGLIGAGLGIILLITKEKKIRIVLSVAEAVVGALILLTLRDLSIEKKTR